MFEYKINSGISKRRISTYFKEICDDNIGDEKYTGRGWTVELRNGINQTSLKIPMTIILFSGEKEACESLIGKYRMKFLSAGG